MASASSDKGKRRGVRIGKYEVQAHIATGGMGAVYRAVDVDLGREVALKVLSPELAARPGLLDRFRQEARSAAKLRHENIVAIYEFGEAAGTYFLALEFVDGVDLHDYVAARVKLAPEEARQIIRQAARALDHAYAQGIVHRDIKPSNFLVCQRDGRALVKLTDLGLAREVNDQEFRVTRAGTTVGTIDYMSPEQARDSRAADIRSDIYSLGCTFFHLLTGQAPFGKGSLTERIYAHMEAEPPDIRRFNTAMPAALEAVLRRMLAKRPEDRFQTPRELLTALEDPERFVEETAAREPRLLPLEPAPEPPRPAEPPPRPRPAAPLVPSTPSLAATRAPPPREEPRPPSTRKPPSGEKRKERRSHAKKKQTRAAGGLPAWWPWAAGAGAVALATLVVLAVWRGGQPSNEKQAPGPPSQPVQRSLAKAPTAKEAHRPKLVEQQRPQSEPHQPGLAPLYPGRFGPDPAKVRAEYEGPLAAVPAVPDGPVYRVSRLPGRERNCVASITEALARIADGDAAVIEIEDNGPLFEPSVPALGKRRLLVRAGKGFHPLLAWDVNAAGSKTEGAAAHRFLAVSGGSLVLKDLDLVVKWPEVRAAGPAVLCRVQGGDLMALHCTFSVAGKHPQGTVVAAIEGPAPARCCLRRCFIRGADVSLVHLHCPGAEVLVEDCLAADDSQPLCRLVGTEGAPATLRLVRSTLVGGTTLLQARPEAAVQRTPALNVYCCDSVLAQNDPRADGVLVQLLPGFAADRIAWKALSSIYAGWKMLVGGGDRPIPATALADWWRQWGYSEGDKALLDPWPPSHYAEPEDVAATVYDTAGTGAHYLALTTPGPLGCPLAALPPGQPLWPGLTFDPFDMRLPSLPGGDPPTIPPAGDGLYHGERLALAKGIDLGQYLQARLAQQPAGPTVVLRLSGTGELASSPLRLQGSSLVIHFEKPPGQAPPLTLVPGPAAAGQEALIQVEDGDLEMLGGRIRFATSRFTLPQHVLKVRGGRLRLHGCHLQGPLTASEAYQGLIAFAGPPPGKKRLASCAIRQTVLLSGRAVLKVQGACALRVQQSLALAADDFLVADLPTGRTETSVQIGLENNTLAVRRALLDLRGEPAPAARIAPIVIRAEANLFLAPFESPGPSTLLRCDRALLAGGHLLWQGKGNGFDRQRLHRYVTLVGEPETEAQPFPAWGRLWGSPGEQAPLLLDLSRTPLKLSPLRLSQLALPRSARLRAGDNAPGADLDLLGILSARK